MTPEEFVKKVGWDEAVSFTNWYGGNTQPNQATTEHTLT